MSDSFNQNTLTKRISTHRSGLPNKQQGITFLGAFALIAVLLFLGLFAMKVGPSYIEYLTVAKIADDVAANPKLMKAPKSKVLAYIGQAYRTNNLWDLKPKETIKLSKDGRKGYKVEVDYEKRANLISNIYVVTKFNKEAGQP